MDAYGVFPFYFTSLEEVFSIFLCEVLWKLGGCEKCFVMGRWQIRIVNFKSTIINIKVINF